TCPLPPPLGNLPGQTPRPAARPRPRTGPPHRTLHRQPNPRATPARPRRHSHRPPRPRDPGVIFHCLLCAFAPLREAFFFRSHAKARRRKGIQVICFESLVPFAAKNSPHSLNQPPQSRQIN